MTQKSDLKSQRQHRGKSDQQAQELEENFLRLIATSSNQKDHYRENLVNSDEVDEDGSDKGLRFFCDRSSFRR